MTLDAELIASHWTLARAGRDGRARVSFDDRVANAASAGFSAIGWEAADYEMLRDQGRTDAELAAVLARHEVALAEIDACPLWYEGSPLSAAASLRRQDAAMHMAEVFGPVHHVIVPLLMSPGSEADAVLADRCAALAERAAHVGMLASLEFVPWSAYRRADEAWRLAEASRHSNCGINVDIWHHVVGGGDPETLRAVPGARVFSVHLTDGAPDPSEPDPLRQTQTQRRVPGEGVFPLGEIIGTLDRIGVSVPLTVEVVSLPHRHLSPADFARVVYDAASRVLLEARRSS